MPQTADRSFLIWSLTGSALGTTIAAAGNSGPYVATNQNARTPIDLRWADDLWLSVSVTGITGTPSLKVQLNFFDDMGNLFQFATSGSSTPLLGVGPIAAAGYAVTFGGRHGGGGSGSYFVAPEWGQIAWTQTGASSSCTGVEIALYGR